MADFSFIYQNVKDLVDASVRGVTLESKVTQGGGAIAQGTQGQSWTDQKRKMNTTKK